MSVQYNRVVGVRVAVAICCAMMMLAIVKPVHAQRLQRARLTALDRANEVLQLRNSRLTHLDLNLPPGQPFTVQVAIEGQEMTLELEPHSVRAANYRVVVQEADGSLNDLPAGPSRTYRGHIPEIANSAVAASLSQSGMSARIILPGDQEFWIEPAVGRVPNVAAGTHLVYSSEDNLASAPCATDQDVHAAPNGWPLDRAAFGLACGSGMCVAEVACDVDFEFFTHMNSSVADVETHVNELFNAVDLQYERDVKITHRITTVMVRTTSNDPYTASDSSALLTEFRNHWNVTHGDVPRDIAHLFSGRELDGGTIGVAWLNAVCGSYAYGLVEGNFTSNFAFLSDLSAHELGHNWGARHCSCTGHTMNPYITGANLFNTADSIPDIVAFRDSRSCLEALNGCSTDADCDDGNACNGVELCVSGSCMPGTGLDCNDGDPCTTDACDSTTGGCVNTPTDCDDGDVCTADACDAAGCVNTPFDCDDGNLCTTDGCSGGECTYGAVTCDDGDPCTDDACDPASGCFSSPVPCSAGQMCLDGLCVNCVVDGACTGGEDCSSCPQDCTSGAGAACGNGVCESAAGEDCLSCAADCNGKQNGNPTRRYCCGAGGGVNPVGCADSRCSNNEWSCTDEPAVPFCCGDGTCSPQEDVCTCSVDCGAPSATEGSCSDGADADCDGAVDCDDADCTGDPACACNDNGTCEAGEDCTNCPSDCPRTGPSCGDGVCDAASGENCLSCTADCNGRQNGRPGERYCCGDGGGSNPVDCGDARCTANGNSCSDVVRTGVCCGDGQCDVDENSASCAVDCQ